MRAGIVWAWILARFSTLEATWNAKCNGILIESENFFQQLWWAFGLLLFEFLHLNMNCKERDVTIWADFRKTVT